MKSMNDCSPKLIDNCRPNVHMGSDKTIIYPQSTQKSTSLQSFSWQSTVLKTMRSKVINVVFAILIAAGNMCPYREIQYPQHFIPTAVVKLKSLKFIVDNRSTETG